jgi:hypothetical protein
MLEWKSDSDQQLAVNILTIVRKAAIGSVAQT